MLVNCECDIYLCRECSGPGIDWADPGAISDAYDYVYIFKKNLNNLMNFFPHYLYILAILLKNKGICLF